MGDGTGVGDDDYWRRFIIDDEKSVNTLQSLNIIEKSKLQLDIFNDVYNFCVLDKFKYKLKFYSKVN